MVLLSSFTAQLTNCGGFFVCFFILTSVVLVWGGAKGHSVPTLILGSQALCLLVGMTAQRPSSELTDGPVVTPAAVSDCSDQVPSEKQECLWGFVL